MKRLLDICIALLGLFAVIAQYVLMLQHRTASVAETTVRFFSFFTILTNSLVAVYFTRKALKREKATSADEGNTATAITMYIFIVGLVYQLLLRQVWDPTGLQKVVDELLHTLIPLLVLLYWFFYVEKSNVTYRRIPRWLIYPFLYLCYILLRGHFSGFYPYPFIHVGQLGLQQVLINAASLMLVFVGASGLLAGVAAALNKRK